MASLPTSSRPAPFTVSALTRAMKDVLVRELGQVAVVGELSQYTNHRSGHWYFALRDADAVVNCVMFRGNNQQVRFRPELGQRIVVTGQLDVYGPQGKLNLLVRTMQPAGDGNLRARLEALKRKLHAEGLFDPARKRPLPSLPRAIGVATSPTGAAFHDVLKVLRRRFPGVVVYFAPCKVQGIGAAEEVVGALHKLAVHGKSEVIIVGRGGGSAEDLAVFDEESVARAIAACPIPVVSAVGHEVDVSIADLVADVRAATPSHAAELIVPERDGLLELVDELEGRLAAAAMRHVARRRAQVAALRPRDPASRITEGRLRCDELHTRLLRAGRTDVDRRRRGLGLHAGRLHALSPLAVLDRGYAVALHQGRAVTDATELSEGAQVDLRFARGRASATVTAVVPAAEG